MKKAIVLGIMAFFAINLITVQNANAQDKKNAKPEKPELKVQKHAAKGEAAEFQKDEKAPKTEIKECEKKECDKKGKDSCCSNGKEIKTTNAKDDNLKIKPKEIKVERENPGKPENTNGKNK